MSSKFVISDPKNPYKPNLNTDRAKTATPPLLGVVFANLRACHQFLYYTLTFHRDVLEIRDQRPKKPIYTEY